MTVNEIGLVHRFSPGRLSSLVTDYYTVAIMQDNNFGKPRFDISIYMSMVGINGPVGGSFFKSGV